MVFERIKFYFQGRSPSWAKIRKEHLFYYPKCSACGTTSKLEVHHIIPFKKDPAKELDINNLMTLCEHCHLVLGHLKNWDIDNTEVKWLVSLFALLKKSGKKLL